jgi:tRNA/rRNA methyltransferase/tRNA (cytidine32/uridine32-2'-O)-methyltransferase
VLLKDIVIILARPSESGNVGAVCRAMKTMGLSRLRLVSPNDLDETVLLARAVHAGDIWKTAEKFDSLEAAALDCSVAIGITRRRGRKRKSVTLDPESLAAYLKERPGCAGLVFGNERTGLETGELEFCNLASHIPANEEFPSLNLSQAVQIYAYQLFRALASFPEPAGAWIPLNRAEIDALTLGITNSLASLGFYKQPNRTDQEQFFRDLFSRAGLSQREGAYLHNIFAKIAGLTRP